MCLTLLYMKSPHRNSPASNKEQPLPHRNIQAPNKEQPDVTDGGGSVRFQIIRILVLVVLTLQNCALTLVTSYSRSTPGPKYLPSSAVVMGEVLKTTVVLAQLVLQNGLVGVLKVMGRDIYNYDTMKFAVPAIFYTIQNNLWYYAMDNLDAMTVAVMSQLKVFTTAIFSIILLSRKLTSFQWVALFFLVMGLTVMQTDPSQSHDTSHRGGNLSVTRNVFLGLLAMVAACTSSGYASVYLELLFKRSSPSIDIWIANMQLQLFCLPVALLAMSSDLHKLHDLDPFVSWDRLTCAVVFLNALGGFMVSLTMKYSDNITKTFAVSVSLVLNCILSWTFMSVELTLQIITGVVIVIGATWLYGFGGNFTASSKAASQAPTLRKDVEEQRGDEEELSVLICHSASPRNSNVRSASPNNSVRNSPSSKERSPQDIQHLELDIFPPPTNIGMATSTFE
mmetsp:Transcript_153727/g.283297  ORF Transcript_153727/g.283297 Transcript_153727/m.283297 type:complete len:451 (-) Transcript_153727:62-1414(-)